MSRSIPRTLRLRRPKAEFMARIASSIEAAFVLLLVAVAVGFGFGRHPGAPFIPQLFWIAGPPGIAALILLTGMILLRSLMPQDGWAFPMQISLPALHCAITATVAVLLFMPSRPVQRGLMKMDPSSIWTHPTLLIVSFVVESALTFLLFKVHRTAGKV